MKIVEGSINLKIERIEGDVHFSCALEFAERSDSYLDTSQILWRIRAGKKLIRAKNGEARGAVHLWKLKASNRAPAWMLLEVQQNPSAPKELFGLALDPGLPLIASSGKLCHLPDDARALCYIASHDDLIKEYGADPRAGREHHMRHGAFEGRRLTFSPYEYAASFQDTQQFVSRPDLAAKHYIETGRSEGRPTYFNAVQYAAGYPDVAATYGLDVKALAEHFVLHGQAEGRHCDNFDWEDYVSVNPNAPKSRHEAAVHYINKIFAENSHGAQK